MIAFLKMALGWPCKPPAVGSEYQHRYDMFDDDPTIVVVEKSNPRWTQYRLKSRKVDGLPETKQPPHARPTADFLYVFRLHKSKP